MRDTVTRTRADGALAYTAQIRIARAGFKHRNVQTLDGEKAANLRRSVTAWGMATRCSQRGPDRRSEARPGLAGSVFPKLIWMCIPPRLGCRSNAARHRWCGSRRHRIWTVAKCSHPGRDLCHLYDLSMASTGAPLNDATFRLASAEIAVYCLPSL